MPPRSPRGVLLAAALLLPLALSAARARADFISAPDVVVYCDPTLSLAMQAVGDDYRARTGVPVRVRSAPAVQTLELIARGTRDDVLATSAPMMDEAAARHLIVPGSRYGAWRDPVVLAGRFMSPQAASPSAETMAALLGGGRLAVTDPTAPGVMDGPALVARLGWDGAAARLSGAIDGPGVAFLVSTGAARLGLMERTDLGTAPNLSVVAEIPPSAVAPRVYAAAISHTILSRNTAAFMAYLRTPDAAATLRAAGLEIAPQEIAPREIAPPEIAPKEIAP